MENVHIELLGLDERTRDMLVEQNQLLHEICELTQCSPQGVLLAALVMLRGQFRSK